MDDQSAFEVDAAEVAAPQSFDEDYGIEVILDDSELLDHPIIGFK